MKLYDKKPLFVLDVGTTNIRVVVFDNNLQELYSHEQPTHTASPHPGWLQQDPMEILETCKDLIKKAEQHIGGESAKIGIANQRESVLAWSRETGKPLSELILWSDKRTLSYCEQLKRQGKEEIIRYKTGLTLTPYSSASKIHWLLSNITIKDYHDLAVGTLDSWLVYKLTGNFYTDYTNACRTMLYNIHTEHWDKELLELFGVSESILPKVTRSRFDFGTYATASTHMSHHIAAVVGDQQASMYAAGTKPGTTKITYGTGIFPMRIIGKNFRLKEGYLTTLAIGKDGEPVYALEGKVENAAPRVSKVFGINKPAFDKLMITLAHEAADTVAGLVGKGQVVYVDGGISQNDDILAEQERLNHIRIKRLSTYHGTALGVAALIRDF